MGASQGEGRRSITYPRRKERILFKEKEGGRE